MSSNTQPPGGTLSAITPYFIPTFAASVAIIPIANDLAAKSALQKGAPISSMSYHERIRGGIKLAPTVGSIIGIQMIAQQLIEKSLMGETKSSGMSYTLASSALVGITSAPFLAVFNGQTMGWTISKSLQRLSLSQCTAIAVQETAFVGGLCAADKVVIVVKSRFGDNKVVDYAIAFGTTATGSLIGHPANTILTRLQNGMTIDHPCQLMRGAMRRAWGMGKFGILYRGASDLLNFIATVYKQ